MRALQFSGNFCELLLRACANPLLVKAGLHLFRVAGRM